MSDKDILSPPIQIMGERRYRVNVITDDYSGPCANLFKNNSATTGSTGYREPDLYDDDEDDEEYEVEELGNSIFKTTFHVPRVFYGGLIGFKGSTKRRIETESKTEITIPGVRDSGTIVTVKGKLRKDVCGGRRRIELLCESLRRNTNPTHFACVPACTPEMQKSFNEFKQSVLAEKYPGIDERLFISTEKIHITLATCTLLDDEERIKAAQIFTECKELVTNTGPIEVIVQGLEIMNDDSSMVSVLYGRVVAPALQEIGEKVLQKYRDAGFNNDQNDRVKLHMTVMNARYRNEVDVNSLGKFDARHLLRKFGDYKFGQFQITELHLSQMHTTAENGFYVATGIINV